MMKNLPIFVTLTFLATLGACLVAQPGPQFIEVAKGSEPLIVLTGRVSDVEHPLYLRARTQADFDQIWIEHEGDRVNRGAQGWPMPPQINFERCEVLMLFGGEAPVWKERASFQGQADNVRR